MILGTKADIKVNLYLDGNEIEKSWEVFCLGITIVDKLCFKNHIENICQRAKYKLHALQRTGKYLSTDKAMTLCNAFYKNPAFLCVIKFGIWEKIVNLESTRNSLLITTSGT